MLDCLTAIKAITLHRALRGAVAQLAERVARIHEAKGFESPELHQFILTSMFFPFGIVAPNHRIKRERAPEVLECPRLGGAGTLN